MARAQRKEEILKSELPPTLPLMALRSTIVYPLGTIAVQMGAPENLSIIRSHDEAGLIVGLVVASGDHDEAIDPSAFLGRVGVAARVHERINLPGDTVQITLQGLRRIIIEGVEQREPYPIARIRPAPETPLDPIHGEELMARLVNAAETLAELVERIPDEVPAILKMNMSDPGRFADLAATNMNFRIADKDEVIQRLDIGERIRFVLTRLEREVQRARVMEDIKRQTEVKIEQHQPGQRLLCALGSRVATEEKIQCRHAIANDLDGVGRLVQLVGDHHQFGVVGVVFHQQDVRRGEAHGGMGRLNENVAPPPGDESAQMRPPKRSTMRLAFARPAPVP